MAPVCCTYLFLSDDVNACSPRAQYDHLLDGLEIDAAMDSIQHRIDTNHYQTTDDQCMPYSERVNYNTTSWVGMWNQQASDLSMALHAVLQLEHTMLGMLQSDRHDPCPPDSVVLLLRCLKDFLLCVSMLAGLEAALEAFAYVNSVLAPRPMEPAATLSVYELRARRLRVLPRNAVRLHL